MLKNVFCVVLSRDFQPCQRYPTGFLQFFINFHACNQETTKILMGKCRIYFNSPFENAYRLLRISKIQVKFQSPISQESLRVEGKNFGFKIIVLNVTAY